MKPPIRRAGLLRRSLGALLPLLPYMLLTGPTALPLAIGVTGLALFAVGATMSLFTGRHALFSGLRMLALGGIAGAVTFAIGRLAGVALG